MRNQGLERLANTVDSCKLFKCPYKNCGQFFTGCEMKTHRKTCSSLPLFYPFDFLQYYYNLDEYLEFLNQNEFKTFKFIRPMSQSQLTTDEQLCSYSPNDIKINYAYYFCVEQILVYFIGIFESKPHQISYGVYYQLLPSASQINDIDLEAVVTVSLPSEEIINNSPITKMVTRKMTLTTNAINILDINDVKLPHAVKDQSIRIGYNELSSFYHISKNIDFGFQFQINKRKLTEIDNVDS
jgi:hypothetical protein